MTIQIPDPGTGVPADQTGDSPWLAMEKVADNFSNQTHAASRLVGTADGQIPLAENIKGLTKNPDNYTNTTIAAANVVVDSLGEFKRSTAVFGTAANKDIGTAVGQIPLAEQSFKAAFIYIGGIKSSGYSADDVMRGETMLLQDALVPELAAVAPSEGYFFVEERALYNDHQQGLQTATGYGTGCQFHRIRGYNGTFQTPWQPISTNPATYATTTAAGANTVVDSTGKLMRSTSSERYKDILAPLVLDDAKYADAMALKPIVYRSTADADNPLHHFYSFSAEELGAYDPAFTLWRTTEMVTDADGVTTEQPLAEKQAEGININALLAMSHAIAIKQDKLIKQLEVRVLALEPKTEA